MNLRESINDAEPMVMHIDLNSCFATVEQQARVRLRGRPLAVVNRLAGDAMVITASYEAKTHGVKTGMRISDAKRLCRGLVVTETDPPKYRYVYHKLLDIMNSYSASVSMKSIDEGVIDFKQAPGHLLSGRALEQVGLEVKARLKAEVGGAMRCNVGIATNRFLAKTAAGLHKPDGLDVITADNLRKVYAGMKLTDLTGIAERNRERLESVGIMNPLQFLDTPAEVLHKMVFMSVNGDLWHQRLRGWEVDDVETQTKRIGRQFVLDGFTMSFDEILQRLHNLCESVGERLRAQGMSARGVYVGTRTFGMTGDKRRNYWHAQFVSQVPFFSNDTIYALAKRLFMSAPPDIRDINVHVYLLSDGEDNQLSLFADEYVRSKAITGAVDEINYRYGERTIHAANTLPTNRIIKTKIPFGSTRYL